jgi:hypothetical protein
VSASECFDVPQLALTLIANWKEELNRMAIRTKDFVQLGFLLSNTGTLCSVMCFRNQDSFHHSEAVCESAPSCSGDDSEMLL